MQQYAHHSQYIQSEQGKIRPLQLKQQQHSTPPSAHSVKPSVHSQQQQTTPMPANQRPRSNQSNLTGQSKIKIKKVKTETVEDTKRFNENMDKLTEVAKELEKVEQDIVQIDKYVDFCFKKYKPF